MKRASFYLFALVLITAMLSSCGRAGGEFTGREYMPDMAHSISYEANHYVYYQFNTWGGEEEYRKYANPGLPVKGTVPFNAKKAEASTRGLTYPRYNFPATDEGRELAIEAITQNPLRPTTEAELAEILDKGQNLYEIYCASCHGKKGDGNGKLYNEGSGPYPAAPANYLKDEFVQASEGLYYHAIMHGKGVMLSHADKLSHDERWMVIHYIRSLQAKNQKKEYDLAAANGQKEVVEEEKKDEEEEDK